MSITLNFTPQSIETERRIPDQLSVYFDLLRFCAALIVAGSHISPMLFPRHPLPWPAHDSVLVFFVLSGFVIADAANRNRYGPSVYIQHRAARILSVAIPALVLSSLVSAALPAGMHIYAAPSTNDPWDIAKAFFVNLFFLGQIWGMDLSPPVNAPYWSLNFEVWYYIIFGFWTYLSKNTRWLGVAIAAFVAGPKIIFLMPAWLMGVIIYRYKVKTTEKVALGLYILSVFSGFLFFWLDASVAIRTLMEAEWPKFMYFLRISNQFVGDIIMGLIISVNFIAVSNISFRFPFYIKKIIRFFSSYTFSIYLFHMPAFAFVWGVLKFHSPYLALPVLVLIIGLLGSATEKKLPFWRQLVARLWPPKKFGLTRRGEVIQAGSHND